MEALDGRIEKTAAREEIGNGGVDPKVPGDTVVKGQIDEAELAVEKKRIAGKGEDRGDVVRRDLSAFDAARLQVVLDVIRQRPGVLVRDVDLEGERARRRRHGVRRQHVEPGTKS